MNNDIQTQLEDYFTNHLPSGMEYCSVDSWELIKEGKDSSIYEVELDYKTSENEHEYRTEKVEISKDGDVSVKESLQRKNSMKKSLKEASRNKKFYSFDDAHDIVSDALNDSEWEEIGEYCLDHLWDFVPDELKDEDGYVDDEDAVKFTIEQINQCIEDGKKFLAHPDKKNRMYYDWLKYNEKRLLNGQEEMSRSDFEKAYSKDYDWMDESLNDKNRNMNTKINIRESLNKYDLRTDNKYDLRNLYDSCNMNDKEKRTIAEMIYNNARANALYEALMNKFEGKSLTESLKESKANPYQNISEKDVRNLEKELKKAKDPKRKSFLQATINKYKKELKSSGKLHESVFDDYFDRYEDDEDKYSLVGVDGNAYAVMGYTARALKREGLRDLVDQMHKEATSGDYDNLLVVCMKYVDMANEAARKSGNYKDIDFDESLNESKKGSYDDFYLYFKNKIKDWSTMAKAGTVYEYIMDELDDLSNENSYHDWGWDFSLGKENIAKEMLRRAKKDFKWLRESSNESLKEGMHADDELTRQMVELLKIIIAGDNLASIGAMEDLMTFMEDLPVGTIIDRPQRYVIQQIRKQGDDSYTYQFDGMGDVYNSRNIDGADAREMMAEWAEKSGPETLRVMSESLSEAADQEVDRKGFVSLIKYGVFDPGGNYAVLRDGNFVYKFWADDDEEAKEMFRNNLKESLYESEFEKDFWSELDEIVGEYLSGKISEDTFGDKYEELANMYLSKGGEEAKRLAWQIAGANSADTYLNMDDPTAEDFDRCMESANTEAKILDKYGFSNYAEMIRRDMREAEKEQEDSEH